jgi:acyl-coenzyme A synthetase/AMP-(fatty) acid ligase
MELRSDRLQGMFGSMWPAARRATWITAGTRRDDLAFWMYCSGLAGRPKGIVRLQPDMLYSHLSYTRHVLRLKENDVCCSVPKIFFAYGFGHSITFPFAIAATNVPLPGQPTPATIFETIARYRPTVFFGLPTLYTALSKVPEARTANLSSLRLCVSAVEILAAEVFNAGKQNLRPGSHGRLGVERGPPHLPLEYRQREKTWCGLECACFWNRPHKTAEAMRERGWIYTADRFVHDTERFHFFRGRADDLVKISGRWVYPLEVEQPRRSSHGARMRCPGSRGCRPAHHAQSIRRSR